MQRVLTAEVNLGINVSTPLRLSGPYPERVQNLILSANKYSINTLVDGWAPRAQMNDRFGRRVETQRNQVHHLSSPNLPTSSLMLAALAWERRAAESYFLPVYANTVAGPVARLAQFATLRSPLLQPPL